MNEQTWLVSEEPVAMLDWLMAENTHPRSGELRLGMERKLRLFTEAFHALGFCEVRVTRVDAAHAVRCVNDQPNIMHKPAVAHLFRDIFGNPFRPMRLGCSRKTKACTAHAPEWLTPIVLSLAEVIYDGTDDGKLDVLGLGALSDAIEEAGCQPEIEVDCPTCSPCHDKSDNPCGSGGGYHPERDPASGRHEGGWTNCKNCNSGGKGQVRAGIVRVPHQLLAHLRKGGSHVRGCWALDLVLGKE
jgi:hypothetical protein